MEPTPFRGYSREQVPDASCGLLGHDSRSRRAASWLLLAVAAITSGGCRNSVTIHESPLIAAVVYGRVTNALGDAVVNAEVMASAHEDSADCLAGRNGLSGGVPARTDARGYYRDNVTAPLLPAELCVSLRVVPVRGGPVAIAGGDKKVRLRYPEAGRILDSVSVDVRIP